MVSAQPRKHWRDAIRETWKALVPETLADVRFFVGSERLAPYEPDTVYVECDDSYHGLPEKIRSIVRWALDHDYDYILKCDDDVVLKPEALLQCGYEQYDFSGKTNRWPTTQMPYPVTVGFNYWLSKRAMRIVATAELPPEQAPGVKDNDDEKWVAGLMHRNGIQLHHDTRYEIYGGEIEDRPPSRLYRPLRPPKINSPQNRDVFSWTIFLEANSGDGIPIETKLREFHKVFARVYTKPNEHPLNTGKE